MFHVFGSSEDGASDQMNDLILMLWSHGSQCHYCARSKSFLLSQYAYSFIVNHMKQWWVHHVYHDLIQYFLFFLVSGVDASDQKRALFFHDLVPGLSFPLCLIKNLADKSMFNVIKISRGNTK